VQGVVTFDVFQGRIRIDEPLKFIYYHVHVSLVHKWQTKQ